jgi:hypothetical protein
MDFMAARSQHKASGDQWHDTDNDSRFIQPFGTCCNQAAPITIVKIVMESCRHSVAKAGRSKGDEDRISQDHVVQQTFKING